MKNDQYKKLHSKKINSQIRSKKKDQRSNHVYKETRQIVQIVKHLQHELEVIHSFFHHRKPKNHHQHQYHMYLQCVAYFKKFGINLDDKDIWNHIKITDCLKNA